MKFLTDVQEQEQGTWTRSRAARGWALAGFDSLLGFTFPDLDGEGKLQGDRGPNDFFVEHSLNHQERCYFRPALGTE